MEYIFAIPSYKRSEEQLTLAYLEELGYSKEQIYISTQTPLDYQEYAEKYAKRANIVFKEGNCVADNRNTLLDTFPKGTKIVMLDDDISYIGYKKNNKAEKFDKKTLDEFIKYAFNYCEKNKSLVWVCSPYSNVFFMNNTIDKRNISVGTIMGIKISDFRFNNQFRISEDYEFCLNQMSKGFNSIRFNYVFPKAKHKSKGGCEEEWNKGKHNYNDILANKYPDLCKTTKGENGLLIRRNKNGK